MALQAKRIATGDALDYTPGSAVVEGAVVVIGGLVCVAERAIAASVKGAVSRKGVYRMPKASGEGAIAAGAEVYWDEDGNPDGGTAGTGAITETSAGNVYAGVMAKAAASGDTTADVALSNEGRPDESAGS